MDDTTNNELQLREKLAQYEREIRKLNRENSHLKNAISQEKTAYTTVLNQQKASTFIQREREKYLALLLANSPSIILFLSQTNRIEFCTEYFVAKIREPNKANILGRTLTEVLSPFLDEQTHLELIRQNQLAITNNVSVSFDATFYFTKGGEAENFAGLLVPMSDEQLKNNGIMLMLHDVTDLKRSREEALAASRAKSAFLSNMSHEIRTPMNAIIGMTAIGKKETDAKRKDYAFEKIESASTHLLGVINDILDISKIESGKMELSAINFNFSQMLGRVSGVVSVKMQDKKQRFSYAVAPDIPAVLLGDDQRIAQVITNLLSNATKFTPDGGEISLKAELLSLDKGKCVIRVLVKDSGIGMTKQEQGKLFNIFQQAEAGTARKYGGSGLGLAISKRILELMDGEIWVESEKGKGSCFFFTITLDVPEQAELSPAGQSMETDGYKALKRLAGKSVLVADDLDINLEIVVELLKPANLIIDTACNGKEAFDKFAANPKRYDLILMDVQMPDIDGIEAAKMIRALNTPEAAAIPIIAMTANVFKEDIEKCKAAGMNDHLGKPIEIEVVFKMLLSYLS